VLTNSDLQKLKRYVDLAPYMTTEQQQALLECIRKLKAIEAAEIGVGLPSSAVTEMTKAVPDELLRDIVEDRHRTNVPGWTKPEGGKPVVRGSGWQEPRNEDRTRQFQVVDDIVNYWAGGPNDTSKLK
jgi:hypothetical protein